MNDFERDHIVHRQIFDLNLASEDEVQDLASEVERIYNRFLIPMLDRIFTKYDIPGHIIKIDRLEIDLGHIDPADIEFSMVKAFEKALVLKLTEILDESRVAFDDASAPEIIPAAPVKIELLTEFLNRGRLPALAQLGDFELENLMLDLIQQSPTQLRHLLAKQVQRSDQTLRRLVLQFSETARHSLYRLLVPQHDTFVRQVEKEWKEAAAKLPGVSKSTIEVVIAQGVLNYLLSAPVISFDRKVFQKQLKEYVERRVTVPLEPLYEALPEGEPEKEAPPAQEKFNFLEEDGLFAREIERISHWLPEHPTFLQAIAPPNRIPVVADLLLDEHPEFLHELFQESFFAENETFVHELVAYYITRKAPQFIKFLTQAEWTTRPEVVYPTLRIAAVSIMKRAPQVIRKLIFESDLSETANFRATPAFRIWQTLFAVQAAPLRRQLMQSGRRREALRKLLYSLPTSDRPSFFAWLEPSVNRPVRIWMGELQNKIPELKAIYTAAPRSVSAFYAVLLDYGLKSTPSLAQAMPFMRELRKEIEVAPRINQDLKDEVQLVPLPKIPQDLEEEVEVWEQAEFNAAETEKREAEEEIRKEEARAEQKGQEEAEEAEQQRLKAEATESDESQLGSETEEDAPDFRKRPSWKDEAKLMAEAGSAEEVSREAQMDFVAHYFVTGEVPWWAETWTRKEINPILESLISLPTKTVRETMKEILVKSRSASQVEAMITLMLKELSEPVLQRLIHLVFPDISGFIQTIVLAFTAYRQEGGRFDIPTSSAGPYVFRWQPILRAVLGRTTSAEQVPTMLARSVAELAKTLSMPKEVVQSQLQILAKEATDQGESRFFPLVHMLMPGSLPEVRTRPTPEAPTVDQPEETPETEEAAEVRRIAEEEAAEEIRKAKEAEAEPEVTQKAKPDEVEDEEERRTEKTPEAEAEEEVRKQAEKKAAEEEAEKQKRKIPEPELADLSPMEILDVVTHFLQHGSLPPNLPLGKETFESAIEELFDAPPPKAGSILTSLAKNRDSRKRMVERFTPEMIISLVELSLPMQADAMLELIQNWFPIFKRSGSPVKEKVIWEHVIHYVGSEPVGAFEPFKFLRSQLAYVTRSTGKPVMKIVEWVKEQIESPTVSLPAGLVRMFALIEKEVERNAPSLKSTTDEEAKRLAEPEEGEELYIKTAGIVLLHPFLAFFFEKLELVKNKEWVSEEAQRRAVLLLNYVVTKQNTAPEFMLPLNKILCGLEFSEPLEFEFEPTQQEIEFTESLLEAVVSRWTALKNTSPDGLRGAFLVREGKLTFTGTRWILRVDSKPFDMLLDKLTWSINIIKMPWMETLLMVEWR